MGERSQLTEKLITELVLQHFDNKSIGHLLNKAPLKQGVSILPESASDIIRQKAIQNLLLNKNFTYVISILESGQFDTFVQNNYENTSKNVTLDELKDRLKTTSGSALDYLLYLISREKTDFVVQMFNGNPLEVKQLSQFLEDEGLNDFRFDKLKKKYNRLGDPDVIERDLQINKLKIENQRLQKKIDRKVSKTEREGENKVNLLKKTQLEDISKLKKMYESEIANLQTELISYQRELNEQVSKIARLNQSILKLKDDLEIQHNLKRPSILVVGNLPENSILDTQQYRISTITKLESNEDNLLSANTDLIKVYLQSEYVSIGRYLEIKKLYPKIPMEYISRENMKKGN